MKRHMSRAGRVVAGTAALLLALAPTTASAQESESLAGYVGMASGAAWSFQPIFPGLLPTGDAPFEITYALSNANVQSGGNSYALASLLWPGSAAANIAPLLGAARPEFAEIAPLLPPYPVMAQANQDEGEVEIGGRPGPWMRAIGRSASAEGNAQTGGTGLPALVDADVINSVSRSFVEDGKLIAESVVTLEGVRIAGGVITIDTVRSISSATSDGTASTSTGSTNLSGLKVQGVEAVLTGNGVEAKEVPGAEGGLPLGEVTEALPLNDVLGQLGISMSATPSEGVSEGPAADRSGTALHITMDNPAAALNPQFAGSRFEISLASTSVGAVASPPFDFDFDDAGMDFEETLASTGGFGDLTGTTQQTIRESNLALGGGGTTGVGGTPSGGGRTGSFLTEPIGQGLEYVGGVTPALVAGWVIAAVIGARWVSRYVGRIVSIEE
jgi:hypothetical protein